jgi:DNA invertase Pin-like site-specific DNA recombinase
LSTVFQAITIRLNTSKANKKLFFQIFGALAEYEAAIIGY